MDEERRKTEEEIACEVIRGEWGEGKERQRELRAAGYDDSRISRLIQKMLYGQECSYDNALH